LYAPEATRLDMEGHFDKEAALAAIKRTRMLGEASMTGLYALNPYLYKK
jgi:hypothetical protein